MLPRRPKNSRLIFLFSDKLIHISLTVLDKSIYAVGYTKPPLFFSGGYKPLVAK